MDQATEQTTETTMPAVNRCPQVEPAHDQDTRPFRELMDETGLLWLINRTVFHPRGFALALVFADEDRQEPVGWQLVGDGTQLWTYDPAEAATEVDRFHSVTRFFDQLRDQAAAEVQAAIDELVQLGLIEVVDEGDDDESRTCPHGWPIDNDDEPCGKCEAEYVGIGEVS